MRVLSRFFTFGGPRFTAVNDSQHTASGEPRLWHGDGRLTPKTVYKIRYDLLEFVGEFLDDPSNYYQLSFLYLVSCACALIPHLYVLKFTY